MDVLCAGEWEFVPQSIHKDVPVTDLYLQVAHAVQLLRELPVYPLSHKQRLGALLPELEFELA